MKEYEARDIQYELDRLDRRLAEERSYLNYLRAKIEITEDRINKLIKQIKELT